MARRNESELDRQEAKVRASILRVNADVKAVSDAVRDIPVTWSSTAISEYLTDQARGWASRAGTDASARISQAWQALRSRIGRRGSGPAGAMDIDFSDI